ncbi:hypothetical protein FF125_13035 [Aureibaculum algae]|uniref:Curlin n=1 Tax=Aureibaculum algae TaxID=2584122 RepID=A0A5B7TW44_9FLAO|nr:hypothetical protein [Aureibaculum algae]QCX39316.1 hypothetical protein FF125_13035 [Aureibaculum algae]
MKIKYITLLMCLVFFSFCNAQQLQDENSTLINAYFNQNQSEAEPLKQEHKKSTMFSKTTLFQNGDYNYINIKTSVKDNLEVTQNGDQNFYEFMSFYGSKDSNMQIFQTGNNNGIYIYGENSLSKNIIINQKTDNQHIFITNYN